MNDIVFRLHLTSLLSFLFFIAVAQTKWTGTIDGNWDDPMNWDNGVPDQTKEAIIGMDNSVVFIKNGILAKAKGLLISGENVNFTIEENGQLKLEGAIEYGWKIESGGSFTNKVENSGYVEISNAGNSSIFNQDSFINYGTIYSFDNLRHSIENTGYFFNKTQGKLDLEGADSTGFFNSGTLINQGDIISGFGKHGIKNLHSASILNYGSIDILKCQLDGLINQGTFLNYDSLSLNNISGSIYIDNHDTLINMMNAYILVHELTINSRYGITNHVYIENNGKVEIISNRGRGIRNFGRFSNFSTILMDSINKGIINLDTFNNQLGYIEINNRSIGSFSYGIRNLSYTSNAGEIRIRNGFIEGILNEGILFNHKDIYVDSTENGVENSDTIYNSHAGLFEISNSYGTFGGLNNKDFFSNQGPIEYYKFYFRGH